MPKPDTFSGTEEAYATYRTWLAGSDPVLAKLAANRLAYRPPAGGDSQASPPPPPARHDATRPAIPRPVPVLSRPAGLASEIVVARYREDLSWLKPSRHHVTIYNKGPQPPAVPFPHTLVSLPNSGREAGTWLHHIVAHYDDLADVTYLLQGDGPVHQPDLLDRIRPYDCPTCLSTRYRETIPPHAIKVNDKVWVQDGMEMRLGDARSQTYSHLPRWFDDAAWGYVFESPVPDRLWFCYSAQFALPRASIRARPLAFYRWLQSSLTEDGDKSHTTPPINPWSMEALWLHVFDPAYKVKGPRVDSAPGITDEASWFPQVASCVHRVKEGCGCQGIKCTKLGRVAKLYDDCRPCVLEGRNG